MASASHTISDWSDALPGVELQVRHGNAPGATYALDGVDFLIGTLPGCDLRVGADPAALLAKGKPESAAVVCLIARHPAGASLRKLTLSQSVLVNDTPVSQCDLSDGDRVQVGKVEIQVHITPAKGPAGLLPQPDWAKLPEPIREFRKKIQACTEAWNAERAQLQATLQERDDLLEDRGVEIADHKRELAKVRQEMADLQGQLAEQYENARAQPAPPSNELENSELAQRTLRFDEERRLFEERQSQSLSDWTRKNADLVTRENIVAERERAVQKKIDEHKDAVVRLHQRESAHADREAELKKQIDEAASLREKLRLDSAEFEEQVVQIDQWRVQLNEEAEKLAKERLEHEGLARQTAERSTSLEGQQASLAVLRGRMERMRDEVRDREQKLDEERAALKTREADIAAREQDLEKQQLELRTEHQQYAKDRAQWLEHNAKIETAVRQIKTAQENVSAENQRLHTLAQELEARRRQVDEAEGVLHGRLVQLAETQERLVVDRKALQERSVLLLEREQACVSLQEQLQRRGQELAGQHKEFNDRLAGHQQQFDIVEKRRVELENRERELNTQIQAWRAELERKAEILQKQHAEVAGFDEKYKDQLAHLAAERKTNGEERAQFHREQQASLEKVVQARRDLEAAQAASLALIEQFPDAELRAGAAVDRLGNARAQLREHLNEIHQYVRECQDEMEQLRGRLQNDVAKIEVQEKMLRRSQDEHRLAVVAFRQELIDWQGQIGDLRRLLSVDETRLERKQAKVEQRARAMDEATQRLAEHAEVLQEQERDVAERRSEIDRHLGDMQAWYRGKLRELAGVPLMVPAASGSALGNEGGTVSFPQADDSGIIPTGRSILSMTASADPGDQKLGQVLRDLQLIDADTLTALLTESRRQRRSLRQVLLASGVITLYQLALIEAGNVGGLVLGPVRIIDRIRHTALETVYRVFDPRRGAEAVLRHLSEANMTDAVRPDEFRDRFREAMVNDPHLATTLEVLELAGRPAVLQEWLTGLPASDWPALAAAPGVCYRLLTQAAQGLASAHQAGLIHGHLMDAHLLLTGDGVLKICGLGEPAWLAGVLNDEPPTLRDDLRALGKIASSWCTPSGVRKGPKTKPLPEALVSILYRMAADGEAGYGSVTELLGDLQKAAEAIPTNAEAWDRLLKYVRENGAAEATLRQSA